MNSQIQYNKDGIINAIPIITYHNLTYNNQVYNELPSTIMVPMFAQMMKYLHDNGFKVLVLNQLGFDTTKNVFYLNRSEHYNNYNSSIYRISLQTSMQCYVPGFRKKPCSSALTSTNLNFHSGFLTDQ